MYPKDLQYTLNRQRSLRYNDPFSNTSMCSNEGCLRRTAIASTSTMDPQTTMNTVIKTIYCSYVNVATPNLNTN